MNVLQTGKSIENGLELLTEGLLSILDLTGVETCAAKFSISDHALSITPISFFFFSPRRLPPSRHSDWGIGKGDGTSDTADLEAGTNLRWQLSLSTTQDNVQKFLVCGHRSNLAVKKVRTRGSQGRKKRSKGTHIFPRRLHDGPQESSRKMSDSEVEGCWGSRVDD